LSGHETGLLIINFGTHGTTPGIAGYFDLEISAGQAPTDGTQPGGLTNIGGGHIFRFEGRVSIMFNTTLVEQVFDVPSMFRDLLPTTSPTHYVIFKNQPNLDGSAALNPGGAGEIYIKAKIQGSITLFDVVTLTGFLSIGVGVNGPNGVTIEIAGAASASVQYIGTISGTLHFIFFSNYVDSGGNSRGPGLVGRANLALADGGAIPGISIGGQVLLEVNTFVGAITVNTFQIDPLTGLLILGTNGLPALADQDIGSNDPAQDYDLRLMIVGHMDIGILHLDGKFQFLINHDPFRIAASLDANMTLGSFGYIHVSGAFELSASGFAMELEASLGVDFGHDIGLSFNVSATVQLSTFSAPFTLINGHVVQSGFFLALHGDVTFLGFASASGDMMLRITNGTFEMSFNITVHLGPIDVSASGFAGIYGGATEAHKGIVLQLAVSLDVNVLDIIKIHASGELRLNTTNIDRPANGVTIGHNSFRLSLNGSIRILEVINLSATFDLIVGGGNVTVGTGAQTHSFNLQDGQWVFAFGASADFFGLASMSVGGWIDWQGEFDLALSGQLILGSSSFGLVGQFSVRVYLYKDPTIHFHLDFSASVDLRVFGFSFASVGISGTFDAVQAAGQDHIDINISVTVRIHLLFVTVSKTAHFTIGTIRLPPPIFLAGDKGAGDGTGGGVVDWNGGDLYLNMGPRSGINGLGSGPDESFIIEHVGGTASSETIKVTAGGRD